ncbi:MAG TPA: hypothetical protein VL084_14210 [Thermoanaerobaculia bacterium]|nr:hypothetical protein [Thermoanaerobaculia bacterium]
MKVTRRFRVRDTGDSLRYRLEVDDVFVGSDDFLGVEESLPGVAPDTVLDRMLRQGVQRTTATAFLWRFLEEKKRREEAGGALFVWEQKFECDL